MHLNHLAGLLPFFEPSIEWDDFMPSSHFRLERPTSRGLHTFVPLPPSSHPPTMVSQGGIPSQLILNPEPNLRPTTPHQSLHRKADHTSGSHNEPCNPVLTTERSVDPTSGTSVATDLGLRRFGPSNGPHRLRTPSRRRNTNQLQFRKHEPPPLKGLAALARFLSSPMYHLQTSTLMTQIMM